MGFIDDLVEDALKRRVARELATPAFRGFDSLQKLAEEFDRSRHHGYPVVDDTGKLAGVVTIQDLKRALERGVPEGAAVKDIATLENIAIAHPDEPVGDALRRLGVRDIGRLPVVSRGPDRQLLGVVRRVDIIRAYNIAVAKRADRNYHAEVERLSGVDGARFIDIEIPPESQVVGRRVREIDLPAECLVVSVTRGRGRMVAHGHTLLKAGDRLTVFVTGDCAEAVHQCLTAAPPPEENGEDEPGAQQE